MNSSTLQRKALQQHHNGQLKKTAEYFKRNLPSWNTRHSLQMAGLLHQESLKVLSSFCQRPLRTFGRWNQEGAETLPATAVAENGDWDNYHKYRDNNVIYDCMATRFQP
jgi:hypothetical protein